MARAATIEADWYAQPELYDLALRGETRREADFIEAACRKYVPGAARRLLEPACGTGRLVTELAARGYDVTGFDLSHPALDYLRRRLKRRGLRATVFEADMADFRLARPVDAALNTFNTFRHLLSEREARAHLECVAAALRPGGIYILGLHLMPRDGSEESAERWTARHGRTRVTVTLRVVGTDWRRRVERLALSLVAHRGRRVIRLRHEFALRLYRLEQFRRLLRTVPQFELCDVYDFWYEIDRPRTLDDRSADTVFILRKRA